MTVCLLSPVWPDYRRFAPLLSRCLERFWPDHPPLAFTGLIEWGLPGDVIEVDKSTLRNWSASLRQGVREVRRRGFTHAYLIAEEHLPLADCHSEHLGGTIPRLAGEVGAHYVSLMGWDNRRYASKSPKWGPYDWMHLVGLNDPRFHLHPAFWNLETLEACCELALENPVANGSAWHFEKVCARAGDRLPSRDCYQISAAAMSGSGRAAAGADRWVFNRLMAAFPYLPAGLSRRLWRGLRFDNVYCDGPYPMVFSGALAKGTLNPALVKFRDRVPADLMAEIECLAAE
ncbi:MAG: hypothetical protein SFU53_03455 [Terrimicrobiaceae bacterium]|nr:hypothetical protein [Terrimicrobiaceae bacterium]